MKMFAKCLLACSVLLPMAGTAAAQTETSDFKPHFEGGVYVGYSVPIAYESGLVCPEVVAGYRFNPYLFVGGSVANILYDPDFCSGLIPVMADARGFISCGSRWTIYGEIGMGVAVGYGGENTDFAFQIGPGFEYGRFSFGAIAVHYDDAWNFMTFKVGWKF